MIKVIKLLEPTFPGNLIGKEVITRDSKKIGVCSGIILDISTKNIYILVSSTKYVVKIPLENIVSIEHEFITVDFELPVNISISSEDLQKIKNVIRDETMLLSKLMMLQTKSGFTTPIRDKDYMAKLFHLI